MPEIEIVTSAERPDLHEQARAAFLGGWPEFIFHDPLSAQCEPRAETYFPQYAVLLLADGEVVAGGWGVPVHWRGTIAALPAGYDGALVSAVTGHENAVRPDTLSVMATTVKPDRQGTGLAGQVLTALRERAMAVGLERVIAPVRPALKSRYPLTPMEQFARWARSDGLHLDPWIRTHQRLGPAFSRPHRAPWSSLAPSRNGRTGPRWHSRKPTGASCPTHSTLSRSTENRTAGHMPRPTCGCGTASFSRPVQQCPDRALSAVAEVLDGGERGCADRATGRRVPPAATRVSIAALPDRPS
jgi:GNAT superfamily N-acetyltransferase